MTNSKPKKQGEIEKSTGIRDLTKHRENPYAPLLTGDKKARREVIYDGNHAVVNMDTGEAEDSLNIARIRWVEPDQFVKVYLAQHNVFFDLGKSAQRCCEYLMTAMGKREAIGNDCIVLYHEEFKEYFEARGQTKGTSPNSYNLGMRELADKKLIARAHRRDHWFINPTIIFNGDRARFTTEFRKKKKSHQELMEDEGQQRLLD